MVIRTHNVAGVCMALSLAFRMAAVAAAGVVPEGVRTAGWENDDSTTCDIAPAKTVWTADLSGAGGIVVELREGAEGSVTFSDGKMCVEKTNDDGYIAIMAPRLDVATNFEVRVSAEVHVEHGDYIYSQAFVRAYGLKERITPYWPLVKKYTLGGLEEMDGAVNSAPGMFYRKYGHYRAEEGVVTPLIVVGGVRSKSVWRDWRVEDLAAADVKWSGYYEARTARDRSSERISDAEFDRLLATDVEHTAKLAKVDGVTRLLIDGRVSVPVAYRAKVAFGSDIRFETFAGGPVVANGGVRLVVKSIGMGGGLGDPPRHFWSKRGFDVAGAVEDIRRSLRIAPDALCILAISCNAYPEFTLKEHPDEVWRLADGTPVTGTAGSCVATYNDMGISDTNRWPWVSYASPSWRNAVKANIRALVAELKRTGLAKRIVGFHPFGYHDGQLFSPYEDHSDAAKAEYGRYLQDCPVAVADYSRFSTLIGFRAVEDFGREFKRAMGKDVLVIRWDMGPFNGAADLTEFAYSDSVDISIPQATYTTRRPAMACEPKLPYSSLNLHTKMYWNEFDLRTYGALESWAASGVIANRTTGVLENLAMWRTSYRKLAGLMMAHHSGYWLYDMGGGWYSPPEIVDDIASVIGFQRRMLDGKPSAWRPDVAIVADEAGMGGDKRQFRSDVLRSQLKLFAASGVPYEFWLAEDVMRDPALVQDAKMVVLSFFRNFDDRRRGFVKTLGAGGRTLVFLAESGERGGVDATGFDISAGTNLLTHVIVPALGCPFAVRSLVTSTYKYLSPARVSLVRGPRTHIVETPGTKVWARYESDGAPAIASRETRGCRLVYCAEPAGISPEAFGWLAKSAGAYVPVEGGGLEVDMNGEFLSVHALRNGLWSLRLPYACRVVNVKSGRDEAVHEGCVAICLAAGETAWFTLTGVSPSVQTAD